MSAISGINPGTVSTAFSTSDWHNMILSISGTTHSLYLDASLIAQNTNAGNVFSTYISIQNMFIGCAADLSYGFTGFIDDFKVYNRALLQADASSIYLANKSLFVSSGLYMYYTFDSASNNSFYNNVSGLYDASMYSNAVINTTLPPKRGIGCVSQPSTGGVNLPSITTTGDTTICLWFYNNPSTTSPMYIYCLRNSDSSAFYYLYIYQNYLTIGKTGTETRFNGSTSYLIPAGAPPSGSWTHITVISTSTGSQLYINASYIGITSSTIVAGSTTYSVPALLSSSQGATVGVNAVGYMDDFRIYRRKLTTDEITSIYNLVG